MNQDLDSLGRRVAFARKRRGMTQSELAKHTGIGQPSIATLEGGRTKSSRHLYQVAEALNVPARWLDEGGELPPELLSEQQALAPSTAVPTVNECPPTAMSERPEIRAPGPDTLAQRLVHARERCQLTQGQLASKAGLSQATVGNLERGRNQGTKKILQLAEALGVTPQWLLYGTDDRLAFGRAIRKDLNVLSSEEAKQLQYQQLFASGRIDPPVETPTDEGWPVSTGTSTAHKLPVLSWKDRLLSQPLRAHTSPHVDAWYTCPLPHSPESFYLQVPGDSMAPEYREHELILVDPKVEPRHKLDVVAVDAQGIPAFARLIEGLDGRYLHLLNPAYPDRVKRLSEDMQIVGVVTASIVDRTTHN